MTFKYRYRKQIIIGLISFFLVSTLVGITIINLNKERKEDKLVVKKIEHNKKSVKEEVEENYKVDIKGQVINPGIYSVNKNSRVMDVIAMAGGLTEFADTSVINLSKKIKDEMVIIIYSMEEVLDFHKTKEIEEQVQEKCHQKDAESLINDACIASNEEVKEENKPNGKISINTASKEELMTLSGIGESKAKEIINYRDSNGPFKSIEDIKKVSGIGDNIFAQIKENITI